MKAKFLTIPVTCILLFSFTRKSIAQKEFKSKPLKDSIQIIPGKIECEN
jgi:hypothetical protein